LTNSRYGAHNFLEYNYIVGSLGAIVYSHYSQVRDKAEMRAGVERDKERLRIKRRLKKEQKQENTATTSDPGT